MSPFPAELKGAVGQIIHCDKAVLAVEQNKVLVPPTYAKYLAWGFSDLSIRIGNYDSDKASAVFENIDNGEILCASCPDAKTIVTAGTSTVRSSSVSFYTHVSYFFRHLHVGSSFSRWCMSGS